MHLRIVDRNRISRRIETASHSDHNLYQTAPDSSKKFADCLRKLFTGECSELTNLFSYDDLVFFTLDCLYRSNSSAIKALPHLENYVQKMRAKMQVRNYCCQCIVVASRK